MKSQTKYSKSSANIYKDLGFDAVEAKSLKFRSQLMTLIIKFIAVEKLTQKQAAQKLKVTQPRISNLIQGKIDLFSIGMLLDMAERAGFPIYKKMAIDMKNILKDYVNHHTT